MNNGGLLIWIWNVYKVNFQVIYKGLRFDIFFRLYDKTTLLAPLFKNWSFEANFGVQPDFVLKSEKNFHVGQSTYSCEIDSTSHLIHHFPHKIKIVETDFEGELLINLAFVLNLLQMIVRMSVLLNLIKKWYYF